VVVAHDWLCGLRGGERVLERICGIVEREFEPAGLLAMFSDGGRIGETVDSWVSRGLLRVSWLNGVPGGPGRLRRWLLPMYPGAVRELSRKLEAIHRDAPVDVLISSSSAVIKGLKAPPDVPHLCYCHSPARYVWSARADYSGPSPAGVARGAGLWLYGGAFKKWDRRTASKVTQFIANSNHTARLVREAYGAESRVIHPPVRTAFFTPDAAVKREDFWLVVGALEPYKRVDLAIDAAAMARARLVVAGHGSQLGAAKRRAARSGRSVEFAGRVSDEALRDLYRRARLLVFPQVEDFGIVAAEAQACGLPVVARGAGGALDIVIDGVTGTLFKEPTPRALADAAERAPVGADRACRTQAERFAEGRFDREVTTEIRGLLRPTAVTAAPAWSPR
jgi:glycosyltransferase involved in cell wall biosynthesis